jgi:hypothetical protein
MTSFVLALMFVTGQINVNTQKDPISDRLSTFLEIGSPGQAALLIGCQDTTKHKIKMAIDFGKPLTPVPESLPSYYFRADANKPISMAGDEAIGSVISQTDRVAIRAMLDEMRSASMITFQTVPLYHVVKQDVQFQLENPDGAISEMLKACGVDNRLKAIK